MLPLSLIAFLSLFISFSNAEVTIYTTLATAGGPAPTPCIGAVGCDGGVLNLPPNPAPGNGFSQNISVQLYPGGMNFLSVPVSPYFLGFSLELSVADKLIGTLGINDVLSPNPVFLNLMANVVSRAGQVLVRVGGNSQETATVVDDLPNGTTIKKVSINGDQTFTPTLLLSPDLVYTMANISNLLNVKWFMGIPFNNTTPGGYRPEVAEISENALGDNLIGLQLGNEPDLYFQNGIRTSNYTVEQYFTDFGQVVQDYVNDQSFPNKSKFLAPSVCCGGVGQSGWTPEQVFDTGFLSAYSSYLAYISVQRYPQNNCNISGPVDPSTLVNTTFLNHQAVASISEPYVNTSQIALSMNKPLIMFETNTASCGGFSALSDSFASTLWGIDYALNMAYNNFTHALFHVGGQDDYYNPFTPPSTNQTRFRQWSIGAIYYSAMVLPEIFGTSGNARIIDLYLDNNGPNTPGYAIYENGNPVRVVLMNFLTDDGTGSANYTAYISVGGNNTNTAAGTPSSVQVKYLTAPSTAEHWNITWAGQTLGGPFESDGRLMGEEQVYTYQCDTTNNVCAIPVPAPAAAVVFLTQQAFAESNPSTTMTFATTTTAAGPDNTVTVAQVVLATSNGRGGGNWIGVGSTSFGSSGALGSNAMLASAMSLLLIVLASIALLR